MSRVLLLSIYSLALVALGAAQTNEAKIPSVVPVKVSAAVKSVDKGTVSGRTYANRSLGFEITFPNAWLIADEKFEAEMKRQGFDLSLKAPDSLPPVSKALVNRSIRNGNVLVTAYRSMPDSADNAIVRVSSEDLLGHSQIKDAVDYFDAIRATFASMRLPADFKYSETQAEKLGNMQFAFLDVATSTGKKRMYATVRKGTAIQFTLTYKQSEDLAAFRGVLENGTF